MTTRRWLLACAACAAIGAALAHYLRPPVETQQRATEEARAQVVEIFGQSEEFVTRRDWQADQHRVREEHHGPARITYPDGTVEERGPVTLREETGTRASGTESGAGSTEVTAGRVQVVELFRDVEVVSEVQTQPDWLIGAQVGVGSVGVLYGGQAARRILGPFYVTVGAMAGGGEAIGTVGAAVAW